MKFSKHIIALICIVMIISVGAVSATEDTISTDDAGDSVLSADDSGVVKYYVDSNVAETGDGSQSSPFKTIGEAISVTNQVNVTEIYLANGVYNTTSDRSFYLTHHHGDTGNLSIIGSGENTVIDLMNSGYFMYIRYSDANVLLKDLTITNGKYNTYAVINNQGTLTLDTVNVYNSQESYNNYNGYVVGSSGLITVLNSKFINNSAGGGVLYQPYYVFNSTFINNSGLANSIGYAGAVYIGWFNTQIIESTFKDNTANYGSGALSGYNMSVYNSTFINNKGYNGGAIQIAEGVMKNNKFINNSAQLAGAAIYCSPITATNLTVANNTVENCVSPKDNYVYFTDLGSTNTKLSYVVLDNASSTINSVNIKLYASIFDEEGYPVSGSGLQFLLDGFPVGTAEAINGTANLSFKKYLNGTHTVSVSLPNVGCDVKTGSVTVTPLENIDVYISPDGDDENGDGSKDNPYKTFDKGFDEANSAVNGNLYIKNGVYEVTKSYDIVSVGNFSIIGYEGNATIDLGNITYFAPSSNGNTFANIVGNVTICNVTFINAHSTSSLTFSKIFCGEELKLVGCNFINNTCNIYVLDITYVDIDSCCFINTVGSRIINGHGGRIKNSYISDNVGSGLSILASGKGYFIIDNCEFETIRIHAYANLEPFKITNSKFYGDKNGNEVIHSSSDIEIDNCTFVNQSKTSLYIDNSMANVTNCIFINNKGIESNAAIYYYDYNRRNSLYLSNNTVINSTCDYYVYSNGHISSPYTYVVLGNESIDVESLGYKFTAIGYDDASNKINFGDVDFYLNDTRFGSASYDDECAYYEYEKVLNGNYIVSVKSNYIDDASIRTATLKIAPLIVEVWVSNDGDDENDGSQAHPFKTIEKATSYHAYATTVHICPGTYEIEDSLLLETRDVSYSFIGAGADETIIDLNHEHRFITNVYTKVDISNMTILNAYQFDEDWYMSMGGAIYNDYGGTVNIDSVNFINSTSDDYCYGGAIYNAGKMNISNSNFINSSAADGCGGAIYNEGKLRVVGSKFIDSSADEGGAAIYNQNYLYIKGNEFRGENQDYVCSYGPVDGVTLTFNDNQTLEINDVPVDFTAILDADGIIISGEIPITFTLNGKTAGSSYIIDNEATFTAEKKYGGEYILGGYIDGASELDIRTATLIYNIEGLLADIWVSKEGDDANGDGSRENPYATIEKALTVAYDEGSTIHMLKGTYEFEQTISISNGVTIIGEEEGVIFDASNSKLFNIADSADVTIKNVTFANAKSAQMIYNVGSLTIDNCIFENNTGTSASTLLIYSYEGDLYLFNSIFRNNTVTSSGSSQGVLIYQVGESKYVNTSFYNNKVNSQSSLIYIANQEIWDMTTWRSHWTNYGASVENCKFENNSASIISCESIDLPISDSVFSNNTGKYVLCLLNGYARQSHVLGILNSNFTDNNVVEGIIEIQKDTVDIQNNIFAYNTGCVVFSSGYNAHEIIISNNIVSNNSNNDYGNYMYITSNAKIIGPKLKLIISNNGSYVVEGFEMPLNATLVDEDGNQINGIYVTFKLNDENTQQVQILKGVAELVRSVSESDNYTVSATLQMQNSNLVQILTAEFEVKILDSKVIYVDVFGSDTTGDGSEDNPYASLSRAFEDINAINTTIYIKPGVYSGELNYDKEINIPSGAYVEIIGLSEFGDNVIFNDLSNRFLGFYNKQGGFSYDASFAVKNIIFKDSTFENGFITAESVSVLLENISFINATPRMLAVGGDLAFELTVSNVDIDFNNATFTDSAPFISTVTPQSNSGSVKLINSSFKNGNFENTQYFIYSGGPSDIINSTFSGLSASMGGMSYLVYSWGSLNIDNSVFTNNSVNSMFDKYSRDGSITNSVFDSNMIARGFFISNNGDLTISNCAIVNVTSYGGDAYLFGKGSSSAINLYENWFGNNDLALNPGVIFNMAVPNWVIANVNASDILVDEEATFDIYFTSNYGSELNGIIPTRMVEFILGDDVANYELANNRVTVTYIPESAGELTIKVDNQTFAFDVLKGNPELLAEEEIEYSPEIDYIVCIVTSNGLVSNITFTITVGDVEFANVTTNKLGFVFLELFGFETGDYEVTYEIPETFKYAESSGSYILTINRGVPDISVEDVTDDSIIINVPEDITEDMFASIDDVGYEVLINNTTATIDISDLKPGKYTAFIYYLGDNNYEEFTIAIAFVIPKEDPALSIDVANDTITIELPEDATGYLLVDVEGNGYYAPVENGVASVKVVGLDAGTYDAVITYSGDDNYNSANATAEITVPEVELKNPELEVSIENTTITLSINENATGDVIVTVGGISFVSDASGLVPIDVSEYLPSGTYFVSVKYDGDDVFEGGLFIGGIVVVPEIEPLDPELEVSVLNTTIYVGINENATGVVIIGVGEYAFVFDAEDAPFVVDVSDFAPDTYDVIVTYIGDDVFAPANATATVTVPEIEPEDANLTATAENATITVSVNPEAKGNVLVDVDGTGYYAPVKDGQATINVIGLDEGEYEATVTYTGDDVFAAANTTVAVTVPPSGKNDTPVDPQADINISSDGIEVTLPEDATGYVLVDVGGATAWVPVENGTASIELPELAPGNYTVSVTYTGDKKYESANATETITVEGPSETIFSEDLTKVEKAPDRFEANFTDAEGNPLANADVTFEINGNVYTRTTDATGKAGMNINLEAGNYTVIITNPATGEVKNNTITILPRFEDTNDLVKYFRNDSQYVIKVLGDDGKIAPAGTVVTFNINGVFYNRTVNETGQVKLSINLNPGDYVITAEYKGCRVSNNIKVLPVLTGNDLTKKYGEVAAYEATLVDGHGKAYPNQKVEFNINGVFYYRTTDSNGVAKLNINLMPGKYIITASYGEAAISNNVTVVA